MPSYWVVGAMFGGEHDQLPLFLRDGYWVAWRVGEKPHVDALRDSMVPDDRIAVKRLLGKGATEIEIRALGIITGVAEQLDDDGRRRVFVRWVVPELQRRVAHNGCAGSIHGPYPGCDPWIKDVFQL